MPETQESQRRAQLVASFEPFEADAALITTLVNIRYLSGFTGSNGALLVTRKKSVLFTDPRYTIQAKDQTNCQVVISKNPLMDDVAKVVEKLRLKRIGFENQRVLYPTFRQLTDKLPNHTELVGLNDQVERQRMVKSEDEIAAIRESVLLNSKAFERTLKRIKSTMTESDLAAELEYQMRRLGAEKPSFDTIVATGPRTALPHAQPTANVLGTSQLLLIDMGTFRHGYASDMTRTVHIGKASRRIREMYDAVLESQLAAIDAIRPGVSASRVDDAARKVLRGHGLDKEFVHSTGHGLGLEIHETPRLGKRDQTLLQPGMVVTVEPGVYREGVGGIRIEDTVLVTANGAEILTPTAKEFLAL